MNNQLLISHLQFMVRKDRLSEAISLLTRFLTEADEEDSAQMLLVLSGRSERLQKKVHEGMIEEDAANVEQNKISSALLFLINEIGELEEFDFDFDRGNLPVALAPEKLVLDYSEILNGDRLQLAPFESSEKMTSILAGFNLAESALYDCLLYYDASMWMGGISGFLICRDRLFVKEIWRSPKEIALSDIEADAILVRSRGRFFQDLIIDKKRVFRFDRLIKRQQAQGLGRLLRQLVAIQ